MSSFLAKRVLFAALLLGVAWDRLVAAPAGLGFVGWIGLAVLVALATAWEDPFGLSARPRDRDRVILLVAAFAASLGLLLRRAPTLLFFDFVATLACAGLATWPMLGRSLGRFRVLDALRGALHAAGAVLAGAPRLVFGDARWSAAEPGQGRQARGLAVGAVLALPPVVVVGALLGSADPVFGEFLGSWRRWGSEALLEHTLVAACIAWPVAGWLRGLATPAESDRLSRFAPPTRLDFVGVAPALYAMVGLLAAYLGLQARALFGGARYVEATTGLTYAEYARGGFFQLVAVTSIVLGLLLAGDYLLDRRTPEGDRRYRAIGWVLIVLLGILMASALQRMWVYVAYYGMSDTRLYATAGMAWLGAALGWFGLTILRGRRARFGAGLLVISAGWIAGLNLVNPEAVVVRLNVARVVAGLGFDVPYHAGLSADAVPALVAVAPRLPAADCAELLGRLSHRWQESLMNDGDWREWTLPVARAQALAAGPPEALIRSRCGIDALPSS